MPAGWRPVLEALSDAGWEPVSFEPLAGDVSARRYGRLSLASGERRVVCSYPDDMKDVAERFLGAGDLLATVDVPTPRVDGYSLEHPVWILLEDLGPHTLFERWTRDGEASYPKASRRLVEARELIRRIQLLRPEEVRALGSPPLDRALLMAELDQAWVRFLEPRGLVSDARLAEEVRAVCVALCERLDSATPVPCHRDFMARNLMLRAPSMDSAGGTEELVLIDYQDLRLGPPCYDLASLLNDTLTLSVRERREHLSTVREDTGLIDQYHAAAAQRTLKLVGTFAYFATAGSDRYLRLIPPALLRFLDALAALPEGRDLAPRLRRVWRL
ncbi:MAG: phosphotransferase [Acidobacteria bacterium]|nr:phosphotransferase [Acidobacteriota bacterium]